MMLYMELGSYFLLVQEQIKETASYGTYLLRTREKPGTLKRGAPVFPGSSRLGIQLANSRLRDRTSLGGTMEDMCYERLRAEACVD